jgi:uncharacterized protein Yka (UPF0111/DUF47 family)
VVIVEDRLALLERQGGEHGTMIAELRRSIDKVEHRMDSIEDRMDRGFERLDNKMSKMFVWIVGLQITTFASLASMILSR